VSLVGVVYSMMSMQEHCLFSKKSGRLLGTFHKQ